MKRTTPVVFIPIVCLSALAGCSDKPAEHGPTTTAPGRPRLTASNLPSDVSTICASAVVQRDQLTNDLNGLTAGQREQKLASLDALVEDSCY
jgi:hypothetical protein